MTKPRLLDMRVVEELAVFIAVRSRWKLLMDAGSRADRGCPLEIGPTLRPLERLSRIDLRSFSTTAILAFQSLLVLASTLIGPRSARGTDRLTPRTTRAPSCGA